MIFWQSWFGVLDVANITVDGSEITGDAPVDK